MSDAPIDDATLPIEITVTPDPGAKLLFDGLHAEQELGKPFMFHLDLSTSSKSLDAGTMIGSSCCVWLFDQDSKHEKDRYFHGIITRVTSAGLTGAAYRYKVELRPWIWLLSHVVDCRIFQKKSAFTIITDLFRENGFSDFEDKRQSGSGDLELEYCVQYRESTFAFVSRLMEEFGMYYYHTHTDSAHTLVITDDPNAHEKIADKIPCSFDQTELLTVDDHMYIWQQDAQFNSGKWTYRDYNFTTPTADLTARSVTPMSNSHGSLEIYEYPGPYATPEVGQKVSDVRMQALVRERDVYSGESNSRRLVCGMRFTLDQHNVPALNKEYLITHSLTTVAGAEGTPNQGAETIDTYRVQLRAVTGTTHFRLLRNTVRPIIRGPQTAVVVGNSGDEIMTDEYGRIKVKFHWDRSSTQDSDRTCWIRVAQTWAGAGFGTMFIPRVGMEVVVEFLEGNPDRPIVTGVVYNANNKVPAALDANKTQSTIKSNSSTGGNGFNEFRFEDKAGAEEVYLHAQFDYKREVLNDETAEITQNKKTTVKSGNHQTTVSSGNHETTVSSGNHKIDVSAGTSATTAAQSMTLTVGGNSIKIDTTSITITCGGTSIAMGPGGVTISGGPKLAASAAMVAIN